mmetsp:Transcript_17320/g.51866  ORF Transcript_17320/g.51866 Transcript_17320/m.51866 type:complete len:226 (+) Transcript_17320:241-918(+)
MSDPQQISYACVAPNGQAPLAEESAVAGNANVVALQLLQSNKLPQHDARVSFAQEGQLFHVMVAGGVVHLCMADEAMGRRVPFAFLEDIRARFAAAHSNPADQEPFSLNDEFAPVLAARMEFYNTDPSADAISRTRVAMDDVKKIMINNIEQVLDRGERIELLVHKTDSLQAQAFTFRRQSRRLHHHMWWKNVRLTAAIIASVLIVIYLLVAFHCGSLLLHCHHH